MDYAQRIIRELLEEEVQQNVLINAIKKRHEVSFVYDSGDGDRRGKAERITVQPVCYGLTSAGNPCFRAYQVNGSSESGEKGERPVPGWRLFLLSKVVDNSWKDSGKVFNKPPQYNENGDRTMYQVLVKADFAGASNRYSRGGLKRYNDERHTKNVEKNPFYDFEKQLKKKTIAPNYVLKNIDNTQVSKAERDRQWDLAQKAMKGNEASIADMAKQKDFGNDQQQQTSGPQRKGQRNEVPKQANKPIDYSKAQQNGPRYKGKNLATDNEDNSEENEYRQRNSTSTEVNA